MSKFLRKTVTAVAIATALVGAGVASAADQKPAANPAMTAPGMAAKPAADTSAIDAKFKGDKKAEIQLHGRHGCRRAVCTHDQGRNRHERRDPGARRRR